MKPKEWIETWHKLQMFSKKLTDEKQIAIARKRHYWSCHELRYQIRDNCCLSKKKTYLNITKVEKAKLGLELEAEKT